MFKRNNPIKDFVTMPRTGRIEQVNKELDEKGNEIDVMTLVDQPVQYESKPQWLSDAEDAETIIYEYSVSEDCYYAVIKDGDDRIKVAPGETIALTKDNKIICTGVSENEQ